MKVELNSKGQTVLTFENEEEQRILLLRLYLSESYVQHVTGGKVKNREKLAFSMFDKLNQFDYKHRRIHYSKTKNE